MITTIHCYVCGRVGTFTNCFPPRGAESKGGWTRVALCHCATCECERFYCPAHEVDGLVERGAASVRRSEQEEGS